MEVVTPDASSARPPSPRVSFIVPSLEPISPTRLRRRLKLRPSGDHELINACGPRSTAGNRNAGIRQARGKYLIIVDDDVEAILPDWWPPLVDALERRSRVVCCTSLLWIPGKGAKSWGEGSSCPIIAGGWRPRYWYLPRFADHISGALLACRASEARRLMFDEHFLGSGFEDVDFTLRLRQLRRGAEGLVLCNSICLHHNLNRGRVDAEGRDLDAVNYRLLWKKWGRVLSRNGIHRPQRE